MYKSIFRSIWWVAFISLLLAAAILSGVLYTFFDSQIGDQLADTAYYVSAGMQASPDELTFLDNILPSDVRITWIAEDGGVYFDSIFDLSTLGDHSERPEVQQALQEGDGAYSRYSDTLQERTIYRATRLDDGSVLRAATTNRSIWGLLYSLLSTMALIVVTLTVICALVARGVSRRIVQPLNDMDLDHPERNVAYEELTPMLTRMYAQQKTITQQVEELGQRQREFNAIVDNMGEGLVLMDDKGRIISINKSAGQLFGVSPEECAGEYALVLNRSTEYHQLLATASEGNATHAELIINDRRYQLIANPVRHEEELDGIVMLVLDITDAPGD